MNVTAAGNAKPKPSATETLGLLPARLTCALAVGGTWVDLAADTTPAVVVGAGGSHPAAEFIARLLREHGVIARSAVPLDAYGPERRLIAVSYSGRTPDVGEAIRRIRTGGSSRVVLITGDQDGSLGADADLILAHRVEGHAEPSAALERGFLSFAATVAPAAAALAASGVSQPDLVTARVGRVVQGGVLDVVATGWAWPAALDIESKWVEAGLGSVRLHESKNLSHGRFQSVPAAGVQVIHLVAGQLSAYEVAVRQYLATSDDVVTLDSRAGGPEGGLALLNAVQGWSVAAGAARSVDVSRPAHVSAGGVTLHTWPW